MYFYFAQINGFIIYCYQNVKDMAKLLFWEVIDEMCKNIGKEKMTEIQELLDIGAAEMENTVNSTVRDIAL